MQKVCPRCGTTFECRHDDIVHCHCATAHLSPYQRACVGRRYSDCLCHDCLVYVRQLTPEHADTFLW